MSAKTPENLAAKVELLVESLTRNVAETTAFSQFMYVFCHKSTTRD